jgi:hypothetical protein
VVAGPPSNRGDGGPPQGGAGSGKSSPGDDASSSLSPLGDLGSNAVLFLALIAALGVTSAALGRRVYQIRHD